jgi:hypothetical protein
MSNLKLSNILAASNIGIKHSIEEVRDWELIGFCNAVKNLKIGVPLPHMYKMTTILRLPVKRLPH